MPITGELAKLRQALLQNKNKMNKLIASSVEKEAEQFLHKKQLKKNIEARKFVISGLFFKSLRKLPNSLKSRVRDPSVTYRQKFSYRLK